MCDIVAAYVRERASKRRWATYGELWNAVERALDKTLSNRYYMEPRLLEWTVKRHVGHTGLMLSAIIVRDSSDPLPGEGFFRLAGELALLSEQDVPPVGEPWRSPTPAQRRFWEEQVEAVFCWAQSKAEILPPIGLA